MTEFVNVIENDGRMDIVLNRPDQRNAITVAMYTALADAVERAGQDETTRVITIRGNGLDFTAGNDLADFMQAMPDPSSGEEIPVWRFLKAMARNTVPVIAAVHGNAVGIGTTMLLHCDLVVVEDGARLVMPFADLGLVPEAASSMILPAIAGRRRAARYILLAEPFGASEAVDAGIASHVVGKGELLEKLDELAIALLAKPPQAMAMTQKLLRRVETDKVLERMELENGHFAERLSSDEVRQIIMAFFAERAKAKDSVG